LAALAPAGTGSPAPIVGQTRVPIRIVGIAPVPSAERIGDNRSFGMSWMPSAAPILGDKRNRLAHA